VVDREVISCLCILMGGCMAMTRGRSQIIEIRSNPPGATVSIRPVDSNLLSPAHVELRRKPPSTVNVPEAGHEGVAYVVSLSRAGYKDAIVPIESRVSGQTFVRNLIWIHPVFWGIGLAVDLSTGAGYELIPSSIFVEFQPTTGAAGQKDTPQ